MIPGPIRRGQLPKSVEQEFDEAAQFMNTLLDVEHNEDGTHKAITTPSVTLPNGTVISDVDGVTTIAAASKLIIQTKDGVSAPATRMVIGENPQDGQTGLETQVLNSAASAQRLRLHPQSSYSPSGNDTSALFESAASSPDYSVYRITAANNIEGIYTSGFTPDVGQRGQVLVLINTSGGTVSLNNLGSVSDEKKIIGGPIYIGDDGCVVLVYDDTNEGWQIIGSHREAPSQSYTPVLTASTTNPTNYTGTGTYRRKANGEVTGRARIIAGASFTAGSGTYIFTLPVTATAAADAVEDIGTALINDSDTNEWYTGILRKISTTTASIVRTDARTEVAHNNPVTFAANDQIRISFRYDAG